MKAFACLAVLALAVAGCSVHENAAPAPTTAYVVPAPAAIAYVGPAPTRTVFVPVN